MSARESELLAALGQAKIIADIQSAKIKRMEAQQNGHRPDFLLNGTRFKLNFSARGNVDVFHNHAGYLQGRWVALVPAEDDMHLAQSVTAAPIASDLLTALKSAVSVIEDYLDYEHNGDPWTEDARAMGEMDIDDYKRDGRLEFARAAIAASASAPPVSEGFVVAPHYRGFAALGTGQYVLNHSAVGAEPEFVISVATEAEKAGREVGDERDNAPDAVLKPEAMAVRIAFANVAGLDAMENQLRKLRLDHFPVSVEAITDPDAKGYRPPFCDGGGCLSNCCEDGCAADRELAEIATTGAKP